MKRLLFPSLAVLALIQFTSGVALYSPSLAQEWEFPRPRGTFKVVDLYLPSASAMLNYAEGLVTLDKDSNWAPCLAKAWRWIDEQTIEFKLREDVRFHNGEKFNAQAVAVNWEAYRGMECPRPYPFLALSDDTQLEVVDDYTVRVVFPEPDGLAFVKLRWFFQIAPAFFPQHKFAEMEYGYLPEPGP